MSQCRRRGSSCISPELSPERHSRSSWVPGQGLWGQVIRVPGQGLWGQVIRVPGQGLWGQVISELVGSDNPCINGQNILATDLVEYMSARGVPVVMV